MNDYEKDIDNISACGDDDMSPTLGEMKGYHLK
jgi:hypothetical protein